MKRKSSYTLFLRECAGGESTWTYYSEHTFKLIGETFRSSWIREKHPLQCKSMIVLFEVVTVKYQQIEVEPREETPVLLAIWLEDGSFFVFKAMEFQTVSQSISIQL